MCVASKSTETEGILSRTIEGNEKNEKIKGPPLALGPLRHPKKRNGLLLVTFFGRNGTLWEVRVIEISMREPDFEPFSWFELNFFGCKKTSKCQKKN